MTDIVKRADSGHFGPMQHEAAIRRGAGRSGRRRQPGVRSSEGTSRRIVESAHELLRTVGITGFSLRAVAKNAGVYLATVQHHFPRLDDLVRGIIALNAERYAAEYERAPTGSGDSPRSRLESAIRFNLGDIQSSETRRFFINLWPLLESLDGFSGSLLTELYRAQFDLLCQKVQELHDEVPRSEAMRRAELIAALIEGMFITLPQGGAEEGKLEALNERALAACMAIADGELAHKPEDRK